MDVHNPGVLVVPVGNNPQSCSPRIDRSSGVFTVERMLHWIVATLALLALPALLYITWRTQLAVLQQLMVTKGGPAVMWACIAWTPLANMYSILTAIKFTSHFAVSKKLLSTYYKVVMTILLVLLCHTSLHVISSIAAVIQSGKALPGLPNTGVLMSAIVEKIVRFHIWSHFSIFLACMLVKSPFVALLVGTNSFLYGSALLAIVLAASLPILLTASLFTLLPPLLRRNRKQMQPRKSAQLAETNSRRPVCHIASLHVSLKARYPKNTWSMVYPM